MVEQTIETESYVPTDRFFGTPYIDLDEWRDEPYPHRHVHGGFSGTDTRFTFYFPKADEWRGRMYQPIEGAHAGHEDAFDGPMGEMIGGLRMTSRLGGYMVESNSGHIGDDIDPVGGDDPTLYGYRASTEAARFSKHVATQVYGSSPVYSYVWGGSGGGRRSPLCLEYGGDVWDGALPFMGGGDIDVHGTTARVHGAQVMSFAAMFNAQRVLGDKLDDVVDAMRPGGSGNPFAGLGTHQREELSNLYRLGYPRGDEYMIGQPMGQLWLWSSMADDLLETDPDYFRAFWSEPGYIGHDAPHLVDADRIDFHGTVTRVLTAADFLGNMDSWRAPEYRSLVNMISLTGATSGLDLPVAVEVNGIGDGYRLGTGIRITSGAASGRQLYATAHADDIFFCDGRGEANLERFRGVEAGDSVHVDNSGFLAFCYYYRHHLMTDEQFDFLRVDGQAIYPQHVVPLQSPLMGVPYSGRYKGKLLWVHHTLDASLWPPQGIIYRQAVEQAQGSAGLERFCQRWTENAEHIPPAFAPSDPKRASSTWLVDYQPIIEQSLVDLANWVEEGVVPSHTDFEYHDGKITLPSTAAERGGIQPVVSVAANGGVRAEVERRQSVDLTVNAEVPPGAGTIIAVEWDFDGSGTFPFDQGVSGNHTAVALATTTTYDEPGTYFATARVVSHRQGDVTAESRRVENLASARIVVS